MNQHQARTRLGPVFRAGLFGLLAAALAALFGAPGAFAGQTQRTFQPTHPPQVTGTAADGTRVAIGVQVESAELSPISPPGTQVTAPNGDAFLVIDLLTDGTAGSSPTFEGFDTVPLTDISLRVGSAMVPAQSNDQPLGGLTGVYFFTVPASTTSAQLELGPATISAVESAGPNEGKFTDITLDPTVIPFVAVGSTSGPIATPTARRPGPQTRGLLTLPAKLGIGFGTGGGAVFVVVLPIVVRRRRYDRADREGRVVIQAPPVPKVPPPPPPAARVARAPESPEEAGEPPPGPVVVKVLGPLDFEGLRAPLALSPEREILVFLATHPGESFTSIQLRNAIWAEPRTQPKASTFRNYLTALRKVLPGGALVTSGTSYRLTADVSSDWGRFEVLVARKEDRRAALEEALRLVRGPAFASAFEGRNSPYAWAEDFVRLIDPVVESAGHDLAQLCLAAEDLSQAEWAVSQALLAVPESPVLLEDRVRVRAAAEDAG